MDNKAPLLTVAVSSRALFDFEEENKIFKAKGEAAYIKTQRRRLNVAARRGVAFPLVEKLLALNEFSDGADLVRLVVVSRNDPATGLRVFRAIADNQLEIKCGCFTRGAPSFAYLRPLGAHLFLSALAEDVKEALEQGVPAAHVIGDTAPAKQPAKDNILRIAFDGDAVLFGDESEKVYQSRGVAAFSKRERQMKNKPLSQGPLKPFLSALVKLRRRLGERSGRIRIALITARGAPSHERPIRTLMKWGIEVDEAFFMDGQSKREIISCFGADFYFDDQIGHVAGVTQAGHVPFGVRNRTAPK